MESCVYTNTRTVPFTRALALKGIAEDGEPKQLPQAIAHRGYKAKYPENTMCAFKAAVKIGAHAIETDLHLSKDGVIVLSHVSARPLDDHYCCCRVGT